MKQRYSPWILKPLPNGLWVIDQVDRVAMRVRRFGTYNNKNEAVEIIAELRKEK